VFTHRNFYALLKPVHQYKALLVVDQSIGIGDLTCSDIPSGGGPETITIVNVRQGRYRYRISEDGGVEDNVERLKKSEAQVSVYTSTDVKEFKVGKAGSGFVRVRVCLSPVLSPLRLIFAMA
jgi:hypothetical protein